MPTFLCTKCTNKLNLCFEFKQQIEQSEIRLQELVSSELNKLTESVTKNLNVDELTENDGQLCNESPEITNDIIEDDEYDFDNYEYLNIAEEQTTSKEINSADCQVIIPIKNEEITVHTGSQIQSEIVLHSLSHKCPICKKNYSNETNLNAHVLTEHAVHENIVRHKCEMCDKSYASSAELNRHRKVYHTANMPYTCAICNKGLRSKHILEDHIAKHTGIRKYKCSECDRNYGSVKNLQAHQMLHFKTKRFKCTVCPSSFHKSAGIDSFVAI